MYSYVLEFNLAKRGEDAEEYLTDAARTWPRLWEDIPGVTGTLLLCSALALGSEFEYKWRVDIESLATLSRIDATIKSGEGGWQQVRRDWFNARTSARAQVCRHVAGDEQFCRDGEGREGAIHVVFHSGPGQSGWSADRLDAGRSVSGVVAAQVLRPVMGSAVPNDQTWVRLEGLDRLDDVVAVDPEVGQGRLFGELRELDGALFAGA